jgi:iron uptake system EfeUOB component EfeO/EfeM
MNTVNNMNYIKQLQAQVEAANIRTAKLENGIQEIINHLHSAKFTGVESDGSRKDWVATSDMIIRLREVVTESL